MLISSPVWWVLVCLYTLPCSKKYLRPTIDKQSCDLISSFSKLLKIISYTWVSHSKQQNTFTSIVPYDAHNEFAEQVLLSPFYKWTQEGLEMVGDGCAIHGRWWIKLTSFDSKTRALFISRCLLICGPRSKGLTSRKGLNNWENRCCVCLRQSIIILASCCIRGNPNRSHGLQWVIQFLILLALQLLLTKKKKNFYLFIFLVGREGLIVRP